MDIKFKLTLLKAINFTNDPTKNIAFNASVLCVKPRYAKHNNQLSRHKTTRPTPQ
jgi:hypothetical protein